MEIQFSAPPTVRDEAPEQLAETIRACLSAQRTTTRRYLLNQVEQSLGLPAQGQDESEDVDRDTLKSVLDDLERAGDVTTGRGGKVAAAPLRFVRTGERGGLLIGTAPGRNLRHLGLTEGEIELEEGIPRRYSLKAEVELRELVDRVEGRVLSVETWARLDETPPADSSFLRSLEEEAEREGAFLESPAEEFGEEPVWSAVPEREPESYGVCGWEKLSDDACDMNVEDFEPGLLRRLAYGRYYVFYWLVEDEKGEGDRRLLRLTRSESTRTQYALLRDAGVEMPTVAVTEQDDGGAIVTLDVFVPAQEYRFVAGMADESEVDEGAARYEVPAERLERVLEVLENRLGLKAASGTGQ